MTMLGSIPVSRVLGFHEEFLSQIDSPAHRTWLLRINVLLACGLVLMSMSIGLLVWMLVPSGWEGNLYSISAAGLSAVVLIKVHSLLITLGAAPLEQPIATIDQWKPSRLRLFAFIFLALVLSQPLLLWMQGDKLEAAAMDRVRFRTTLQFEALERARLVDRQQALLFQRSILNDELQRVMSSLSATSAKAIAKSSSSPRKAFLLGAANYSGGINPLPNVTNDIVAMERKLRSMGYAVTISLDESRTEARRKLEAYSASLRSGDISLIYFSGHGMESAGQNYFIPRDFVTTATGPITRQMLLDRAIAITPYIDDLTRERLRLHLLVVDACRTDLEDKPRGLAVMQSMSSRNAIIAMSASPGQAAFDGLPGQKGGNSPYTTSLLSNLDRDEDVGRVFRRVTREVVESTTPITRQQNKPPQTPWLSESIVDLEIKLLPPALERKSVSTAEISAKAVPAMCSANYGRTGSLADLGSCIQREIEALTRQVEFLEGRLSAEAGQVDQSIDSLLERAVFFAERLRLMWSNYILMFLGSLILTSIMTIGLVLRDLLFPQALRAYEKVKHHCQRVALKAHHDYFQSEINRTVNPLRGKEQLPPFKHWSESENFFSSALHRSPITGGVDTSRDHEAAVQMWGWLQNSPALIKDKG